MHNICCVDYLTCASATAFRSRSIFSAADARRPRDVLKLDSFQKEASENGTVEDGGGRWRASEFAPRISSRGVPVATTIELRKSGPRKLSGPQSKTLARD